MNLRRVSFLNPAYELRGMRPHIRRNTGVPYCALRGLSPFFRTRSRTKTLTGWCMNFVRKIVIDTETLVSAAIRAGYIPIHQRSGFVDSESISEHRDK